MPAAVTIPTAEPADSYYLRLGDHRYRSTVHTEGAWQPGEQHMAPVSGVIVHAIERFIAARGRDDLQLSRITFEILGMIPAGDCEVSVETIRPGRTIELLESTMIIGGRPVIRARAWRLARLDTATVAGGQPEPLPPPDDLEPWPGSSQWGGGYIRSLEIRPLSGREPGRARGWLRTSIELVAGETSSDLARFVGLVDTANGIAVRESPTNWMFPNVDLSIHLYRQPVWGWVGLDTTVIFGSDGVGLTTSALHDIHGPVGRVEQSLTVRPLRPT
jgi:hypothetical protein